MTGKQTAIVVSGMHRCGTSSVAGVLHLLGAAHSSDPMPTGTDNPKGFFESMRIMRLNDRILAEAGLQWHDWRSLEMPLPGHALFDAYRDEVRGILAAEFSGAGLLVLKDPRFSRTMPFWVRVLEAEGFGVGHVIAVRHPDEVVASLQRRNALAESLSALAWVRHYLDADFFTRGQPRVFVPWPEFLGDWPQQVARMAAALGVTWPRSIAAARDEVDAFLSPELLHHRAAARSDAPESAGPSAAVRAFGALQLFARDPESARGKEILDSLRAEFRSTESIGAQAIDGLDAALRKARAERDGALAGGNAAIAELMACRSGLSEAVREKQDALARADRDRLESARQVAALGQALKRANDRATMLESRLSEYAEMNVLRRLASAVSRSDRYLNLELMNSALQDEMPAPREAVPSPEAAADLTLEHLLRLNGEEFLSAGYGRLLGRPPDSAGRSHYLPRLLRGAPKIEILAEIGASAEARAAGLTLPGLAYRMRLHRLAKLPLLGAAIRAMTPIEGNSAADRRLRAVEQALHAKLR